MKMIPVVARIARAQEYMQVKFRNLGSKCRRWELFIDFRLYSSLGKLVVILWRLLKHRSTVVICTCIQ